MQRPLELLPELSSAPEGAWRPLVLDEDRRCYAFIWPRAVPRERSDHFLTQLLETAPWVELRNTKGTSVTRSTCWHTRGGCTCDYTYGKDTRIENCGASKSSGSRAAPSWQPAGDEDGVSDAIQSGSAGGSEGEDREKPPTSREAFRKVMQELAEHVFGALFPGLGEDAWPNAANLNLYRDGRQGVGWHADDESLFRGRDSDCPIVSVSLGTPREFWIALKRGEGGEGMDPDPATVVEADLAHGDVLTMEGRMQHHCLHLVPKGNPREPIRDDRINITFRWVREHRYSCPLRQHYRERLPRSLRGILGELRPRHPGAADDEDGGPGRLRMQLPFFGSSPYVRCWSREVMNGVLADPDNLEWRLCDGCKHICYEEGRLCCEGRGTWQERWFCRKCWAKWEPDSVPEFPAIGPLATPEEQMRDYNHQMQNMLQGGCEDMWCGVGSPWWPDHSGGAMAGLGGFGPVPPFGPPLGPWTYGEFSPMPAPVASAASSAARRWNRCGDEGGGGAAADEMYGYSQASGRGDASSRSSPFFYTPGAAAAQQRRKREQEAGQPGEVCETVARLLAAAKRMQLPAMPERGAAAPPEVARTAPPRGTALRETGGAGESGPDLRGEPSEALAVPLPAPLDGVDRDAVVDDACARGLQEGVEESAPLLCSPPRGPEPVSEKPLPVLEAIVGSGVVAPPPVKSGDAALPDAAAPPFMGEAAEAPVAVGADGMASPAETAYIETSAESAEEPECARLGSESDVAEEHPLSCGWRLWLLMDRQGVPWEEAQKCVHGPLRSVEAFWQLLQHAHPASALLNADYSFFREGFRPAREDPALREGGRWLLAISAHPGDAASAPVAPPRGAVAEAAFGSLVDDVWRAALLAMIGGRFCEASPSAPSLVCGVVISLRDRGQTRQPQEEASTSAQRKTAAKLALWLRGADDMEQVAAVGRAFRGVLEEAAADRSLEPRGGWRLAFEDFRQRSVRMRL